MESTEYDLVCEVEDDHWWWVGRRQIIEKLLDRIVGFSARVSIADAGAGFGGNIPMLRQYGDVTALELNKQALLCIEARWGASVPARPWKCPEPVAGTFDLILMADVLEHIPDDYEAAQWIFNHLKPGGYALITVPGHMFLWTQMDEVVHHHRRYDKARLLSLFEKQFQVAYFSYYNFLLMPLKVGFLCFDRMMRWARPKARQRSYNNQPASLLNEVLKYFLYLEASLMPRFRFPTGVSMVLLVRKPEHVSPLPGSHN